MRSESQPCQSASEAGGKRRPRSDTAQAWRLRSGACRVTAGEIPHHGMPPTERVGTGHLLEPMHRPHPSLAMVVIPFEPVVELVRGSVLHIRQPGVYGLRIALRCVGCYARRRSCTRIDGLREAGVGCGAIATIAELHVDDLPIRIARPIEGAPAVADLEVRFVYAPPRSDWRTMHPCRSDDAWRKRLHPGIQRARVNGHAALSQPRRHIGIAEAIAQRVAHRQGDGRIREALATEGSARSRGHPAAAHPASMQLTPLPIPVSLGELLPCTAITLHPDLPSRHGQTTVYRTSPLPNETTYKATRRVDHDICAIRVRHLNPHAPGVLL